MASKLAHDANSWIANATFRLAAMRPPPVRTSRPRRTSTASRRASEPSPRSPAERAAWSPTRPRPSSASRSPSTLRSSTGGERRREAVRSSPRGRIPSVSADRTALATVLSILADNVSRHGGEGPLGLELRPDPAARGRPRPRRGQRRSLEVDGERDLTELGTRGAAYAHGGRRAASRAPLDAAHGRGARGARRRGRGSRDPSHLPARLTRSARPFARPCAGPPRRPTGARRLG